MPDFLDEIVRDRSADNPEFARLVDAAARRRAVIRQLAARRASLGLSQTAVAARMSTSQPVVARLESGDLDSRLSTIERYAAAVGLEVELVVREPVARCRRPQARGAEVMVGLSALGRLLVVVFVDRGRIRIDSARGESTPSERHEHEEAGR